MNRHFQPCPPLPSCPPMPCSNCPGPCSPDQCRCGRCRKPEPPCPPDPCSCDRCPRPEGCFPPHSFLLPRILASGRIWLRRTPFCLTLTNMDPCAQPPYTLLSVEASSAQPRWEIASSPNPHRMCIHVWVPLCCRVKDGCGNVYTAEAEAEADVPMQLTMPAAECWRNTLVVLPCVRLVCAPQVSDTLCITAQLEMIVEAFLTRWEGCMVGMPKPVSPNG